jgi:hypothetical protein
MLKSSTLFTKPAFSHSENTLRVYANLRSFLENGNILSLIHSTRVPFHAARTVSDFSNMTEVSQIRQELQKLPKYRSLDMRGLDVNVSRLLASFAVMAVLQ